MSAPGPPVIPALHDTIGAVQIGAVVGTYLFGIETLQAYYYFRHYPTDGKWLKLMVVAIWVFELGHTISVWHANYELTVTFYCQPQHLEVPPYSLEMSIIFAALMFFANRIRVLSGKWLIPIFCWTLAILRFIANCALFGVQWANPNVTTMETRFKWLQSTTLAIAMVTDITIALSMCYWLWKIRQSRFKRTNMIVDALLIWSLETGTVTSTASGAELILFLARNDLSWFPFFLLQAKLYANSLLVSLNVREQFRSGPNLVNLGSISGSTNLGRTGVDGTRAVGGPQMTGDTDTLVFAKDIESRRDL
ncbi:hypothetical protein B0H13DRAFT_2529218 [Mycena leptocephala]|nr:hypothetical protein B0H13DRAFT_2529218 [Mycena leptocephala]